MYNPPRCQGIITNQPICSLLFPKNAFRRIFFAIFCNITGIRAIMYTMMVGAMAKFVERIKYDDLVIEARTQAYALGRLYELYYERIFQFCVYRLFNKEIAEDITSDIFLDVARGMRSFKGQSERDFRNWLYAIAANHTNAYIRKTSRRKKLLAEAAELMRASSSGSSEPDRPSLDSAILWPSLYMAILKLKPQHQTIVTLRFFENFQYEQIAQILNIKEATVRVTLHRIINKLRNHLQTVTERGI